MENTDSGRRRHIEDALMRCGTMSDAVAMAGYILKTQLALSLFYLYAVSLWEPSRWSRDTDILAMLFLAGVSYLPFGGTVNLILRERDADEETDLCRYLYLPGTHAANGARKLKAWLKGALGSGCKLGDLQPPAGTLASFFRLPLTWLLGAGSRQQTLQAPARNRQARLLATFSQACVIFIDLRATAQPALDEVRMAWQVFGPSRTLFIVDDRQPQSEWAAQIRQQLGLAKDSCQLLSLLVWPADEAADPDAFARQVQVFQRSIPTGQAEVTEEALAFVKEPVRPEQCLEDIAFSPGWGLALAKQRAKPKQWRQHLIERPWVKILAGVLVINALLVSLFMLFPETQIALALIHGAASQVFFWVAWNRARRQRKLTAQLRPHAAPPTGRVWAAVLAMVGSLLFATVCISLLPTPQDPARRMKAMSNARQIVGLLTVFAEENNSLYPDSVINPGTGRIPHSSNEAFRALFQEGLTQEESIFGCPLSAFVPDKNIGTSPLYSQALERGENHWAMTTGLSSVTDLDVPLVFEDPAVPSWPPLWNGKIRSKPEPGRVWRNHTIIVAFGDGTVVAQKITAPDANGHSTSAPGHPDGKPPFRLRTQPYHVLDVDE